MDHPNDSPSLPLTVMILTPKDLNIMDNVTGKHIGYFVVFFRNTQTGSRSGQFLLLTSKIHFEGVFSMGFFNSSAPETGRRGRSVGFPAFILPSQLPGFFGML